MITVINSFNFFVSAPIFTRFEKIKISLHVFSSESKQPNELNQYSHQMFHFMEKQANLLMSDSMSLSKAMAIQTQLTLSNSSSRFLFVVSKLAFFSIKVLTWPHTFKKFEKGNAYIYKRQLCQIFYVAVVIRGCSKSKMFAP